MAGDIPSIIREAATRYGVNPDYMIRAARIESGLNPMAANPSSSARGLFQFLTRPGGSWSSYGRGGNPLDPYANADAGARYTADNINLLKTKLGRDPTPGEMYLAHQQGPAGAAALLADPQARATDVLAKFYKHPATALQAIKLNGGTPDISAGDFAAKWLSKFDGSAAAPASSSTLASQPNAGAVAETPVRPGADMGALFASMLAPLAQQRTPEAPQPVRRPSLATILGEEPPSLAL